MFILSTEHSFDSAHFLKDYDGKCGDIHGHRWRIEIDVFSETLIESGHERGMVIDFKTLKMDFKEMIDSFDHALIIEKDSLRENTLKALLEEGFNVIHVDFRPTAEEFSRYFFEKMEESGYKVKRLTVFETPKNSATYEKAR